MSGNRRPHQKTRTGCVRCKERRIKCDETKPSCRSCSRYSAECIYPQTPSKPQGPQNPQIGSDTRTPSSSTLSPNPLSTLSPNLSSTLSPIPSPSPSYLAPPVVSAPTPNHSFSPPSLPSRGVRPWEPNVKDLELLHFWSTHTCFTLSEKPDKHRLWQYIVPQLAFKHDFLLHGILALAALHLSRTQPERKDALCSDASSHYAIALASFRRAMTNVNPENGDACFAFSAFIVVYAWASAEGTGDLFFVDSSNETGVDSTVEWVRLLRGMMALISINFDWMRQGPMGTLIHLWDDDDVPDAINPEETEKFAALEALWTNSSTTRFNDVEVGALKQTLDILKETYIMMCSPNVNQDPPASVFSWPILVPEEYIQMVLNSQPEALVLLAHYCLLLNKINHYWWMRGMSRHLLQSIHQTVGRGWEKWIAWPMQDLVLSEFRNPSKKNEEQYGLPPRPNQLWSN